MLQVRITDSDGTEPIILEAAENKSVSRSINSSDEGVSFTIAKNHPKAEILNPYTTGYSKLWEVWDTGLNERVNRGPITTITDQGTDWRIEGPGRKQFLVDFIKSKKTFYAPINSVVDDLRFENIAIEPKTSTLVHTTNTTAAQTTVFGTVDIDETYYGLSKNTKDNTIDDNNGLLKPGQVEPPNTYFTTDSYWSGMSTNDSIIVDLGNEYDITKLSVLFPWWGGPQRLSNRTFDFTIAYATSTETPLTSLQGRNFGPFHTIYDTGTDNRITTSPTIWLGTTVSGTGLDFGTFYGALDQEGPVPIRYIRVNISDVHAWFGTTFDNIPGLDGYLYQCDPDYVAGSFKNAPKGAMTNKTINDRVLENANDCHASIVEVGALKEIIGRDVIKPLALQKIDNNNMQIRYYHIPDASETTSTTNGLRRFEPGSFFREFAVTWSGANTSHTKFYAKDCTNCYPDGFNFAILDQNNSMIVSSDNTSGSTQRKVGAYTKHLTMKGASDATVTFCDSWPATLDPLSYGGSHSHTDIVGDYATIHFRGQSFRWFATVPSGKTGATVSIQIRHKNTSGTWTGYSTLESGLVLPNNINAALVYEITYESGILLADTVYEIKITNLGDYCSIDSIEGYWSASYTQYNEDSRRVFDGRPEQVKQIYDARFSAGSMYKWNTKDWFTFGFEGDRIVVLSAKGRNHGKLAVSLYKSSNVNIYDPGIANHVFIPGGDPVDGSLEVDLATSKRGTEIPQYIMFDSNDYFPNGLPWAKYGVQLQIKNSESYTTTVNEHNSENFVYRCSSCKTDTSGSVTTDKYVYLDSIGVHERVGLSVSFENDSHLEILKSVAEAVQTEWDVNEIGIRLEPRIGADTDIVLHEGQNTLVGWEIVNDISQMASMLISTGADIDGLPLFTITEDRKNKATLGRTVMRQQDFRNVADYFQLVGLSRTELKKRRLPEKRITISHIANNLDLNEGDSFIIHSKKSGPIRVRAMKTTINESSSGRVYELECVRWPQII